VALSFGKDDPNEIRVMGMVVGRKDSEGGGSVGVIKR